MTAPAAALQVTPQQYGAKGDARTDDTVAIQKAINAVSASSGGVVAFPPGTYRLTSTLTVGNRVTLAGSGQGASVLWQTKPVDAIAGTDVWNLTCRNLTLMGPGAQTGTGNGIKLGLSTGQATVYSTFTDLRIMSFGQDGINIQNPMVSTFTGVISETNGRDGIHLQGRTGGAAGTSCALTACYGNGNKGVGISLYNMAYSTVNACAGDSNGLAAYRIDSCQGITVTGSGAESQPADSFQVSGSQGITLQSCWTFLNGGIGILVTGGSQGVNLIGCMDNTPAGTASAFVRVDAASRATLINVRNASPNNLAPGTSLVYDDTGELRVPGALDVTGAYLTFAGQDASNLYQTRQGPGHLATDASFAIGGDLQHWGAKAGFMGSDPVARPVVSGAKGGNPALGSLISALKALGLIVDKTS